MPPSLQEGESARARESASLEQPKQHTRRPSRTKMGRTQRCRQRRKQTTESSISLNALYVDLNQRGWQNHTQLKAQEFLSTGRGLCSKRLTFETGSELIRLPGKCLITIATLEADEQFKALFDKKLFDPDKRLSFQAVMACYLMYHQHLNKCSHDSQLAAYLDTLPGSYSMPYFCSMSELQCLPEALLERTVAQNRQIRDYYQVLKTLTGSLKCASCGQTYCLDIWTLADYRLNYFAVNSRSVYLNASQLQLKANHFQALISGHTNLALAPFLDLFNHSDMVYTSAELQGTDYVLTLKVLPTSNQTIKPYEQLFISYGALPNLKLLTEYGFWLEKNVQDYFEISLMDIEHLIRHNKQLSRQSYHRNIFKFIREHNLGDQMFVHIGDGCSHNLRVVLHLIFKQDSYFPNVLNQIAFGDAHQFDDVQPELTYLVEHKIQEYQQFAAALDRLPQTTESGRVTSSYLLECVRYLGDFMAKHGEQTHS